MPSDWKYESRSQRRRRVIAELQAATQRAAPYVQQGDYAGARRALYDSDEPELYEAPPLRRREQPDASGAADYARAATRAVDAVGLGLLGANRQPEPGPKKKSGGFLSSVGSALDKLTPEFAETAGRGALTALDAPRKYVGGPAFSVLTGSTGNERKYNPETGEWYRDAPSFADFGRGIAEAVTRNPLDTYHEARQATDDRLRDPNLSGAGRFLLQGASDPLTLVGGVGLGTKLGKLLPEAVRASRGARIAADVVHPGAKLFSSPGPTSAAALLGGAAGVGLAEKAGYDGPGAQFVAGGVGAALGGAAAARAVRPANGLPRGAGAKLPDNRGLGREVDDILRGRIQKPSTTALGMTAGERIEAAGIDQDELAHAFGLDEYAAEATKRAQEGGLEGKPSFVAMQPHEIANALGLDGRITSEIRKLDMRHRAGSITPDEVKMRDALTRRIRDEYRTRNSGREPVWVLPADARPNRYAQDAANQQMIEAAGSVGGPGTHTLEAYVGGPNYKRMIQLEQIASNPNAKPEIRAKAREMLYSGALTKPSGPQMPGVISAEDAAAYQGGLPEGSWYADPAYGKVEAMAPIDAPAGVPAASAALPGMEMPTVSRGARGGVGDAIASTLNAPRAIFSSMDASTLLRQGGPLGMIDPRAWREGAKAMYESLKSEDGARRLMDAITSDPDFSVSQMTKHPLAITEWGDRANLNLKEESFASNWASKLPGVKQSERASVAQLNQQRWLTWKGLMGKARLKYGDAVPEDVIDQINRVVNAASGRGSMGWLTSTPALNTLMMSPKFLASRVDLVRLMATSDPVARTAAVKAFAGWAGMNLTLLGTLALASEAGLLPGVTVGFDPKTADFGKVKIGDTRLDMWAGYQPLIRYAYNVAKAAGSGDGDKVHSLTGRFIRTKLAPTPGFAYNWLRGEDMVGEDYEPTLKGGLRRTAELFLPGFVGEVVDAWKEEGWVGAALTVPSAVGAGATTYSPATEKLDEMAQDFARGNPRYPQGVKGFYDLEPVDRDAIKDKEPGVWHSYAQGVGGNMARADEIRKDLDAKMTNANDLLLSGKMTLEDWGSLREDISAERRFRIAELYQDAKKRKPTGTALDGFYKAMDDARDPQTGQPDWDAIDAYTASLSAEDQAYIERNTGLNASPPEKLRSRLAKEYYQLPQFRGFTADEGNEINELLQEVRNTARGSDDIYRLRALRTLAASGQWSERAIKGVRRSILGLLTEARDRERYAKAHPELVLLNGRGKLTPERAQAISAALAA